MFLRTFGKLPFGQRIKIGEENLRICMSVYLRDKHLLTVGEKLTVYPGIVNNFSDISSIRSTLGKLYSLIYAVNDINSFGSKALISR